MKVLIMWFHHVVTSCQTLVKFSKVLQFLLFNYFKVVSRFYICENLYEQALKYLRIYQIRLNCQLKIWFVEKILKKPPGQLIKSFV